MNEEFSRGDTVLIEILRTENATLRASLESTQTDLAEARRERDELKYTLEQETDFQGYLKGCLKLIPDPQSQVLAVSIQKLVIERDHLRATLAERERVIKAARNLYTAHKILVDEDPCEDNHYHATIAAAELRDALKALDKATPANVPASDVERLQQLNEQYGRYIDQYRSELDDLKATNRILMQDRQQLHAAQARIESLKKALRRYTAYGNVLAYRGSEESPYEEAMRLLDEDTAPSSAEQVTQWKSCALWPKDAKLCCENPTTDTHATREAAEVVCRMLEKNGFEGERGIFPVRTWVEPVRAEQANAKEGDENKLLKLAKDAADKVEDELRKTQPLDLFRYNVTGIVIDALKRAESAQEGGKL